MFKIGLCYRKSNDFPKAVSYFQKLIDDYPASDLADPARTQISYTYFFTGEYNRSLSYIAGQQKNIRSDIETKKNLHLIGLNYLFQKKWTLALTHFQNLERSFAEPSYTNLFKGIAEKGKDLHLKSRLLAGMLSVFVPGLGKVYAGKKIEGLLSFLTVGSAAWLTYNSFHKEGISSVRGWIYGAMGALFYTGNIYGSIVSVNIYNRKAQDKLLQQTGVAVALYFK